MTYGPPACFWLPRPISTDMATMTGMHALNLPLAMAALSALGSCLTQPSLTFLGWAPREFAWQTGPQGTFLSMIHLFV